MEHLFIQTIKNTPITNNEWDRLIQKGDIAYINDVIQSLKTKNRFFGNELLLQLVYQYITDYFTSYAVLTQLNKGDILYRARIYTDPDGEKRQMDESDNLFKGYSAEQSFISPCPGENRCSPQYIPYLYTSREIGTCIAEVNPTVEDYVSVAHILVKEPLRLINMDIDITAAYDARDLRARWINSFILTLAGCFEHPAKEGHYLIYQYVSEFIKQLGYDGIVFQSSKGDRIGRNYTIFSYEKCMPVASKIYKISGMKYEFN